jgi:hypothetical protein
VARGRVVNVPAVAAADHAVALGGIDSGTALLALLVPGLM